MGARSNTSAVNSELRQCCDTVDVGGTREVTSGVARTACGLWGQPSPEGGARLYGRGQNASTASGGSGFQPKVVRTSLRGARRKTRFVEATVHEGPRSQVQDPSHTGSITPPPHAWL